MPLWAVAAPSIKITVRDFDKTVVKLKAAQPSSWSKSPAKEYEEGQRRVSPPGADQSGTL